MRYCVKLREERDTDMPRHAIGWAVNRLAEGTAVRRVGMQGYLRGDAGLIYYHGLEGQVLTYTLTLRDLIAHDWVYA